MEAFSAWTRGKQAEVTAQCARIAAAGYHGIRALDVLGYWDCDRQGNRAGWFGKSVSPIGFESFGSERFGFPRVQATPNFYEQKRAFLEMLHGLGLKVMDDRGDLNSWGSAQKLEHMRRNGELYKSMGDVGRQVVAGLWACNESWQNGVPDNREAARMIDAFGAGAGWLPDTRGLSWGARRTTGPPIRRASCPTA